jgi:diguanylate cyclase (GGDEF)-like protein
MSQLSETLDVKLRRLRTRFVAALPQRIDAIADGVSRCAVDTKNADEVTRLFHSLAGTAATHRLSTIAALAAEGEEACGEKPFSEETMACLHSLIESMRAVVQPAGKILCVEDDGDHARFIATILEDAGYETRIVEDPLDFNFSVSTFHPDLILMDIMLPGTSGVELARSLRTDAAYATTPIVFLTNRRQVSSRIEAVGAGGDDYLTKPVEPELLLSVVSARLKASRAVQDLIDRDGLTGALTHVAFLRRAHAEMSRAQRNGQSLALVMLDLDHFKSINDCHGHPAGDQVLSAFGSFLARHLRGADDVGRLGGEEFALLLRDITSDAVQHLITRLLDDFSVVAFHAPRGVQFHVTFSAGVAMLMRGDTLEQWKQRADDALYSAKGHGRARVEAA